MDPKTAKVSLTITRTTTRDKMIYDISKLIPTFGDNMHVVLIHHTENWPTIRVAVRELNKLGISYTLTDRYNFEMKLKEEITSDENQTKQEF